MGSPTDDHSVPESRSARHRWQPALGRRGPRASPRHPPPLALTPPAVSPAARSRSWGGVLRRRLDPDTFGWRPRLEAGRRCDGWFRRAAEPLPAPPARPLARPIARRIADPRPRRAL